MDNHEVRDFAKDVIERIWSSKSAAPGLAILHCVSAYPVPPEEANLSAIRTIAP